MKRFNIVGHNFAHVKSSCSDKPAYLVEWDWSLTQDAPTVHLDFEALADPLPGPGPHWAWILETPAKTNRVLGILPAIERRFEWIYTHNSSLARARPDKYRWAPACGIWIRDMAVHVKTKACSMITSPKDSLPGHRYRLSWATRLADRVDLYGLASRIERKEEGLRDYMFSVAIENAVAPGYFTEKILDCFATGTVPIYHGAGDIAQFFNPDGIIKLTESFDPAMLTPELYAKMLPAVQENFERCRQYEIPEDWMARTYNW